MFPPNTRILIVDDMAGARGLLKTQLNGMGFSEITEAENGEIAYSKLESAHELGLTPGLIISDWTMPVLDGLEFLIKVRKNPTFKSLPFLMLTAEGEMSNVVKAIQNGVSDYMVKPFDSDTLFRKVTSVYAKHNKK